MKKFMLGIAQAIIIALLFACGSGIKFVYDELKELRYDVDRLYAEVSDVAKEVP